MSFKLQSPSFSNEGMIPAKFTCQGENVSPELHWSDAPKGTKSFVLICDDPDAPDPAAPKMTWVHWVLYDIPAEVAKLAEKNPTNGVSGITDFKKPGYGGPCPPIGTHRYFFKFYALDTMLNLATGKTKVEIVKAMQGHILAESVLMGKYLKK